MIYELHPPTPVIYEDVFIFVDPAAGGPGSDYGIMSVTRSRGVLAVSFLVFTNKPGASATRSRGVLAVSFVVFTNKPGASVSRSMCILLKFICFNRPRS